MLRRVSDLRRYTIGATDGDIGSVDDVYFDDLTWTVRYLVADTGTWLPGRKVLLSPAAIRAVDPVGLRVQVDVSRQQVEQSPDIDTDKPVSRQHETAIQSHYGFSPYWTGPYRWGPHAYPYPLLHAGVIPAVGDPPYENRVAEELAAREEASRDEHLRSARAVTGYGIRAADGELGHVEDFLVDEHEWAIRYLIVDPRSWWPGPHVLVGVDWIQAVSWNDSVVVVDVSRDAVRSAPRYEASAAFGRDAEQRLYAHHARRGYWEGATGDIRQHPPAA
jgi:sporulation protein YlmC with PRC-barrel domain